VVSVSVTEDDSNVTTVARIVRLQVIWSIFLLFLQKC